MQLELQQAAVAAPGRFASVTLAKDGRDAGRIVRLARMLRFGQYT
jgi:hypothetical protein